MGANKFRNSYISRQGSAQWMTVRYDDQQRRAVLAREFRLVDAAGY